MALASGGSPMFPLVVHQPAPPSIWLAVQSLRRGLSTNPGASLGFVSLSFLIFKKNFSHCVSYAFLFLLSYIYCLLISINLKLFTKNVEPDTNYNCNTNQTTCRKNIMEEFDALS